MSTFNKFMMALTVFLAGGWSGFSVAGEIYKTVDKDGNVVYTDRQPEPGAKPIQLRELSVVEVPAYQQTKSAREAEAAEDGEPTMNELRREFRDFRLVSPAEGQNFWGTGNLATVAWQSKAPLRSGMSIMYYLDGEPFGPSIAPTWTTQRLDRGEHKVRVDLLAPGNQVIRSTDEVVFYIKQQARPQARAVPFRGGG